MGLSNNDLLLREAEITIGELQSVVKWLQEKLEQAEAREAKLQAVVDNLCEQQDRQIDMEAGAKWRPWQSYPSEFPEWEQAWEAARAVRWEVE